MILSNKIQSIKCIEVVCDGGTEYGFGHIRRTYTLVQSLVNSGFAVRYTAASIESKDLLPNFKSSKLKPNICILDLPYEINNFLSISPRNGIPIIALDYFGLTNTSCVISVFDRHLELPGLRFNGLNYAIIRNEIKRIKMVKNNGYVVVMIGGTDLNQVGESTADFIASKGIKVYLIQGPTVKDNYISKSPLIRCLKMPDNLEEIMSNCSWAVTNGGGSMMEMMHLGKPVFVIPQTQAEKKFSNFIYKKGGIIGVGERVEKIPDLTSLKSISSVSKEMIDGNGVERIKDIIKEFLNG
jgi:spore coat polysaccharide biosynthesis predicted glycosyltransferase SpsG